MAGMEGWKTPWKVMEGRRDAQGRYPLDMTPA